MAPFTSVMVRITEAEFQNIKKIATQLKIESGMEVLKYYSDAYFTFERDGTFHLNHSQGKDQVDKFSLDQFVVDEDGHLYDEEVRILFPVPYASIEVVTKTVVTNIPEHVADLLKKVYTTRELVYVLEGMQKVSVIAVHDKHICANRGNYHCNSQFYKDYFLEILIGQM